MKRFALTVVFILAIMCMTVSLADSVLITSSGRVNVRVLPDKESKALCIVEPGTSYPYLGSAENGWAKIQLADGSEGYVSGKMCRIIKDTTNQNPANTVPGIANPQPSPVVNSSVSQVPQSSAPIQTIGDWTITKVYQYKSSSSYWYDIVFHHSKPVDQRTTVNFIFYDKNNNTIGAQENFVGCTGPGYDYFASAFNDAPYDHVEVSITSTDLQRTTHCMDGMKIETSKVNNKIIITGENVNDKPVSVCEYNIVLLDKKGNVITTRLGYLTDIDVELQKGQKIVKQEDMWNTSFDSYDFYYNAYNYGI